MKIPLASSGLRQCDIDAAVEVLNSGNLTMGSKVKQFESEMAEYLGVKHFVMVNSGSSANLAIFEALLRPSRGMPRLNPGDAVLVPAIAWPTTIWPIIQLGLNPIFIDIDLETLAIDLKEAQSFIDKSGIPIRAIFPIHPLGRALNHDQLSKFSESNNLILINDVCESLGSWDGKSHAGTCGIASSYSFYFSHHITTMEGGGIATNDDDYADDLRSIRSHGWSRDRTDSSNWTLGISENTSKFLFVSTGFNIRPMEIQAAIGILQIRDLDNFVSKRRKIAELVASKLRGTDFSLIGSDLVKERNHSWMLLPIRLTGDDASSRKEEILGKLNSLGVETRPVLTGNFLAQPAIQRITRHAVDPSAFPNANLITETSFLVSAHHDLSEEQVYYLAETLHNVALE